MNTQDLEAALVAARSLARSPGFPAICETSGVSAVSFLLVFSPPSAVHESAACCFAGCAAFQETAKWGKAPNWRSGLQGRSASPQACRGKYAFHLLPISSRAFFFLCSFRQSVSRPFAGYLVSFFLFLPSELVSATLFKPLGWRAADGRTKA